MSVSHHLFILFRYINPFWLVLATNLAAGLYAYLFVPESVTLDPSAKLLTARHHRAIYRLYSGSGGGGEGGAGIGCSGSGCRGSGFPRTGGEAVLAVLAAFGLAAPTT